MCTLNQGHFSFTIIVFVFIGHIFSYSSWNTVLYIGAKQCTQALYVSLCNHTLPVYLISTSLVPAETADMHTDIENEDFRPNDPPTITGS